MKRVVELEVIEATQMICDKVSAMEGWPLGCRVETSFILENGHVKKVHVRRMAQGEVDGPNVVRAT